MMSSLLDDSYATISMAIGFYFQERNDYTACGQNEANNP